MASAFSDEVASYPPREIKSRGNYPGFQNQILLKRAVNILDYFLGTPELINNVLFLGSGDLRNALFTGSKLSDGYKELNCHLIDEYDIVTVRNVLIAHIIFSNNFDPTKPDDIDYLWDVWYSLQWTEDTNKRFIKDVQELLFYQWTGHLRVNSACDVDILKPILKYWLVHASTKKNVVSAKHMNSIVSNRLTFMNDSFQRKQNEEDDVVCKASVVGLQEVNLSTIESLEATVNYFTHLTAMADGNLRRSLKIQMECYLKTGNCVNPPFLNNIAVVNPTLFSLKDGGKKVEIGTCPFDAYLPDTIEEQLSSDFASVTEDSVTYCKGKLQKMVSGLRARKDRIFFHFHFGDCLNLCLRVENMKKKFQVIHCSAPITRINGLTNLISSTSRGLANHDAVLLMNINNLSYMTTFSSLSIADYVETSLCCSLSMIPTLYGVRLTNHFELGNPTPFQFHEFIVMNECTVLRWQLSPCYSRNIPLAISPVLATAIDKLAASRFQPQRLCGSTPIVNFNLILQSLSLRCALLEDGKHLLSRCLSNVDPPNRLNWTTEQTWMAGESVLRYSFTNRDRKIFLRSIPESVDQVFFWFCPLEEENCLNTSTLQWIALCQHRGVTGYFMLTKEILLEHSFAFLLTEDHGANGSFFITDAKRNPILSIRFSSLKSKVIRNPPPFLLRQTETTQLETEVRGFYVQKCIETEISYELKINVRGVQINDVKEIILSTDQQHPSFSAHQVTLSIVNLEPLILQVPWPFLSEEVEISLFQKKKNQKKKTFIRLILKKSRNDPFPSEFGGRSKLDVNLLKRWKDTKENGSLKVHIEAQFRCDHLAMEKHSFKSSSLSTLDEVREVVRAIFYGNSNNSFYLFAIHLSEDPVLYLKVQPIMRFSPLGSPLLIISMLDYQLALQLMAKGTLDPVQYQSDYHRIFTEGVSRQVCVIHTSSAQEVDLLRYVFRFNATRMRRSVWQSKNLPRGENSPWMSTFLSPLYTDQLLFYCKRISDKVRPLVSNASFDATSNLTFNEGVAFIATSFTWTPPLTFCHGCFIKKVSLTNKCRHCQTVVYCSNKCQEIHWSEHQSTCSVISYSNTSTTISNLT